MIPESIGAIPGQDKRVVSLIAKYKKSAPDQEFIALSMLECMHLTCYVLPQGKHSTFVGSPM